MPRSSLTPAERSRGSRLGRRLAAQRRALGLSQETLSRAADVSIDSVRRLERGAIPTPGFFVISRLAQVLRLDLHELASDSEAGSEIDPDGAVKRVF